MYDSECEPGENYGFANGLSSRCHSAGGTKAWKEMRKRQREFFAGFDQEERHRPGQRDGDEDGEEECLEGLEYGSEGQAKEDNSDEARNSTLCDPPELTSL